MSLSNSEDSDGRYSDICGATNRNGEPCQLPAGWGTPGSGGTRCKYHGGASTGPTDTSHLEGNNYAEGNPGGGAPEGNTNAEIHGGFSDWRTAYERFEGDTKAHVEALREDLGKRAKKYAPHVPEERREELVKEWATRSILCRRASNDTVGTPEHPVEGARGVVVEEKVEIDGETYTVHKPNPAWTAGFTHRGRKRQIEKELRLSPAFRDREE